MSSGSSAPPSGRGGLIQFPWAKSTPRALQALDHGGAAHPLGDGLDAHHVADLVDRLDHRPVDRSVTMSLTNLPSIFRKSTGRSFR